MTLKIVRTGGIWILLKEDKPVAVSSNRGMIVAQRKRLCQREKGVHHA